MQDLAGANAETMASTAATPMERSLSDISGISSMTLSSSLGRTSITIQFDLTRNIDAAAQDVQVANKRGEREITEGSAEPAELPQSQPHDFTILSPALTSDTLPLPEIDRYADDFMATQISQIAGVGLLDFHWEGGYARQGLSEGTGYRVGSAQACVARRSRARALTERSSDSTPQGVITYRQQ
jgi:multidrug efflux pump subunit AcrB